MSVFIGGGNRGKNPSKEGIGQTKRGKSEKSMSIGSSFTRSKENGKELVKRRIDVTSTPDDGKDMPPGIQSLQCNNLKDGHNTVHEVWETGVKRGFQSKGGYHTLRGVALRRPKEVVKGRRSRKGASYK